MINFSEKFPPLSIQKQETSKGKTRNFLLLSEKHSTRLAAQISFMCSLECSLKFKIQQEENYRPTENFGKILHFTSITETNFQLFPSLAPKRIFSPSNKQVIVLIFIRHLGMLPPSQTTNFIDIPWKLPHSTAKNVVDRKISSFFLLIERENSSSSATTSIFTSYGETIRVCFSSTDRIWFIRFL